MEEQNFIKTYENVLSEECIEFLLDRVNNQIVYDHRSVTAHLQDKQFTLDPFYPVLAKDINNFLINNAFANYLEEFPYLKSRKDWFTGTVLLQKTSPSEGYHTWHCEDGSYSDVSRMVAWMIYLNDVEEGGETEFLYQRIRIKPKKNMAVIWPGSFTHLHRGNPPLKGDKYILTGWFSPTLGMNTFTMA
jgi:hypothetical protein